MTHRPLILPSRMPSMISVVGPAVLGRECAAASMPRMRGDLARGAPGCVKSCPPSRFVVLLNSREPIALHWPVIELAPVPGRPMLPVISARLMMACAVRTPSWLWLTPIVHQNETRLPSWMRSGELDDLSVASGRWPRSTRSQRVIGDELARTPRSPSVCASMKSRSIQPSLDQDAGEAVEEDQVGLRLDRAGAAWPPSPFRSCADRRR